MDGSFRLLAARYLRKQARRLIEQLKGVPEASDVEYVHQARVASRRLRAGFQVFCDCFGRKRLKRWRKHVRRLTQGLGPARDRDVQIEFVQGVLAQLDQKAYRPGVARLLLRLEQSREAIQPLVVKAAGRFQTSGTAEKMLAAAKKTRSQRKSRGLTLQSPFAFAQAQEHVCGRLNELIEYEDCLGDPEDHEQHHAMRIAAKRLRYTLEIFQPVYEGRLDEFTRAVKQLQTLLGDIHDCDVWVADLETFLEEERQRTVAYFGHDRSFARLKAGLEYLQQERRAHRRQVFEQLAQYWRELDQKCLWEELIQTLKSPLERPKGSQRPTGAPAAEDGAERKSRQRAPEGKRSPQDDNGRPLQAAKRSGASAEPIGRPRR
jgi:CHAD domain-containing protein